MHTQRRTAWTAGLAVLLAACGGGSSGPDDATPPPPSDAISWTVAPTSLAFGFVAPGSTKTLSFTALNESATLQATLSSLQVPAGGFALLSPALPLDVPPGQTAVFQVRYAPDDEVADGGTLRLLEAGGGPDVTVFLSGAPPLATEVITDFGVVALSGGVTPTLQVDVPADAISLSIEGEMPGATLGLHELSGPGGTVYENSSSTGEYLWVPGLDVVLFAVPNTDRAALQLVPGGGTYSFRLRRLSGSGTSMSVRAIVERRDAAVAEQGVLDLNVWLARGITPKAGTAASDARLQAVLAKIDEVLSQQGITLGDVDYYDVAESTYDYVNEFEFGPMLTLTAGASAERLNLFFVKEAFGGGVVGVSPTVGGPKVLGTTASGVMSVYEGFSTDLIGLIAAHELGHYLGLHHTVEQSGAHDPIDDTVDCPAYGTSQACPVEGGGYLMHWLAVGGGVLTDGQGLVVRGHPHNAAPPAGAALRLGKPRGPLALPEDAHLLGPGWCATCATVRKQGSR